MRNETTTATRATANDKAMELRARYASISAGVKAGAIPELQAQYARRGVLRLEAAAPFFIRKSFDGCARDIANIAAPGEKWEVGQNVENGLHYAWRKRAKHWEPGEAEGVVFTDPDGLGLDSAFVNTVTLSAGA